MEPRHPRREDGMALIVAMMLMLLMTVLGAALVLTTSSETMVASNFRNGGEGLYAADAVIERAVGDLLTVPDWNTLLNGTTQSAFVDGAPSGVRTLPDGSTIDLGQVVNLADCAQTAPACTDAQMNDTAVPGRPWGQNNPRWQLYAYGKLSDLMPTGTINSPYYVVVMVADDPSENDCNPSVDGGAPIPGCPAAASNPGLGIIAMRAEAFGPRGAHKIIELTVARTDAQLDTGYTGQGGQGEQNRRASRKAIPTSGAGGPPQQQSLNLGTGGIS